MRKSKTKIKLDYPYSKDYECGYLNINKEPRRVVLLIGNNSMRTSTSYARYLLSCKLKRYLSPNEHADHIDGDKLNDVIENLQILSAKENNIKKNIQLGIKKTMITIICPICDKDFIREARNINNKIQQGKTPTCSRSCGGKMSHISKLK